MSPELKSVRDRLVRYAEAVVIRRADRLLGRKIVLMPYLRAKWLLRKIAWLEKHAG